MTTFRKVIIAFYMLLVAGAVIIPFLDGAGVITLKSGTSWLIAQIVTVTAIPASIAAFRAKDFFRDDPRDVDRLEKYYVALIAQQEAAHADEIARLKSAPAAEVVDFVVSDAQQKKNQQAQPDATANDHG